jgi:hypothetical protein
VRLTSTEVGELEANGVILKDDKEETTEYQPRPNGNIGNNSSWELMSVNSDGTVPEEQDKSPGERCGDNWDVNETRLGGVT